MNVELTIQEMFDNDPTLFTERADCLNHLFCVIGNGYEWVDGELVDSESVYDEEALKSHLVDGKAFQHNKMSLRAKALEYHKRYLEKCPNKNKYVSELEKKLDEEYFNSIPDDEFYENPRRERWYFYVKSPGQEPCIRYNKDFAYLFQYPENIKPDWLAAIEECKVLLREDGFDLDEQEETVDFCDELLQEEYEQ